MCSALESSVSWEILKDKIWIPNASEKPQIGELIMSENHLISVPHFPSYDGVRHLLKIWEGCSRKQITDLHQTIWGLVGTPQNVVDWTKPDVWIGERLKSENRDLAETIWTNSNKTSQPEVCS